jgi:hypothetical protein
MTKLRPNGPIGGAKPSSVGQLHPFADGTFMWHVSKPILVMVLAGWVSALVLGIIGLVALVRLFW